MAAKASKQKDLFTASQVARFCQVDLKTIHNWVERDRIPHFRTPGRHLRFRRAHVLDFLRKYGYPIPEELNVGRPRVALLLNGTRGRRRVLASLQTAFEVTDYCDPVAALLEIGEQPPDAVVLAARVGTLSASEIVDALKKSSHTLHVRAILLSGTDSDKDAALRAGASAQVRASDVDGLRATLDALIGRR